MTTPLPQRLVAEALGAGLLVATVVGSGIMAERLAGGNVALALLANTLATVAGLIALIFTFGPISGAHFNPAVSLANLQAGALLRDMLPYCGAQIAGGCLGSVLANAMFSEPLVSFSRHARSGFPQLLGEFVATFGLLAVIWGVSRTRESAVPFAVGAWIAAAYWFTSSTAFANPAVTVARCLSDTFAGIRPVDASGFIVAQIAGALTATMLFRWMMPASKAAEIKP